MGPQRPRPAFAPGRSSLPRDDGPSAGPLGSPRAGLRSEGSPTVVLEATGLRRLRSGHPWIYRDDLRRVEAEGGDVVAVLDPAGRRLAWAAYSARSKIALRLLAREGEPPEPARFLRERLEEAMAYRDRVVAGGTACRLVASEADGLPGVVVDRYGEVLAIQTSTPTAERWKEVLVEALVERLSPRAIVERNDGASRDLEGLPRRRGLLHGEDPGEVWVEEGGLRYVVDPLRGQKTGAFLDQRENRLRVRDFARGRVLDAFAYGGLFGLHALAAGAERVVAVDASATAEALARRNAERNGFGPERFEWRRANAFDFLREAERAREAFDLVILDPPAFAKNRREASQALRGYRDLNLRALRLVRPGGTLVTCSCSYQIREETFLEMLRGAAGDARRRAILLELRGQARDHPVLLTLPESRYLKCAVVRVA